MVNYDQLHMRSISAREAANHMEDILKELSVFTSEVLFEEVMSMLSGDYTLDVTGSFLTDIGVSDHSKLSYCQCFAIIDGFSRYQTRRRDLASFELRYTISGRGSLEYEGKKYTLGPGEGFFISSRNPHDYRTVGDHWKCTVLHLNGPFCERIFGEPAFSSDVKFSTDIFPDFELKQFEVLKLLQRKTTYAKYQQSAGIEAFLTELLRAKCSSDPHLKYPGEVTNQVLEYLYTHYAEDIRFSDLAAKFHVSRATLFAQFKYAVGTTPYNYLQELRIKRAQMLLRASGLSVGEISERVGYNDPGHFGQMFKKIVGTTPLKYRNS